MTLKSEKEKFMGITKLMLKSNLTKNQAKLEKYRELIIEAYNAFTRYCMRIAPTEKNKDRGTTERYHNYVQKKFVECLNKLNCSNENKLELYSLVEADLIQFKTKEQPQTSSGFSESSHQDNTSQSSDESINYEAADIARETDPKSDEDHFAYASDSEIEKEASLSENLNKDNNLLKNEAKMAHLAISEFMKIASGHINKPYSGDPLCLTSFIDSIKLLETLATTNELRTFLVSFVKTKIDGRAREFITTEDSINAIINTLKNKIKPDNSKVIEGRMLSLRLNLQAQDDFAKKTEDLAEAFRRSLVVEGITFDKANEMSIDKTVEVCRNNARSDLVKSVLEASKFEAPKDVIAKLLTQVDKARQEHQVLHFRRRDQTDNFNRNRGRNFRGQSRRPHGNRPPFNNSNSQSRNQHGFQNQQQNGFQNRQYSRGRGRSFYNSGNSGNNGQRYQSVRFANSNQGNSEVPQQIQMGPPQIQPSQQPPY